MGQILINKDIMNRVILLIIIISISCQEKRDVEINKKYYESGKVQIISTYNKKNKKRIVERYYESGEMNSKIEYLDSIKNGSANWYYENGQIEIESFNRLGNEEGLIKAFYPNGNIKTKINFINGKMIGEYSYFSKNGDLNIYSCYDFNEDSKFYMEYDSSGKVLKSYGKPVLAFKSQKKMDSLSLSILTAIPPGSEIELLVKDFDGNIIFSEILDKELYNQTFLNDNLHNCEIVQRNLNSDTIISKQYLFLLDESNGLNSRYR